MHAAIANYNQNPNIGLFCYANDSYCLVPQGFPAKLKKLFHQVLKVPTYEMRAAGTSLLGAFFSGNETLLVPKIMFESELRELEKFKIKYQVINTELTALGNNLLINKVCIANPDYSDKVIEDIESTLKIPVIKGKIAELNIVGSLAKGNNKGLLVSPKIKEFEQKFLLSKLKIHIGTGTVNFGSQYIGSGLVCNSNGFIIGDISGGPEIQNADEILGFIGDTNV